MNPAPYSDDPVIIKQRQNIDYSHKITTEEADSGKADRPVRIYADGIFDLFHFGHQLMLKQAKNAFPNVYLIAGVSNDSETHQIKGPTALSAAERSESVRSCKYVDEVYRNAPYFSSIEFLKNLKIDFVAHEDGPYPMPGGGDYYQRFRDADMFVATTRTTGVSTTGIIDRIIDNIDGFVERSTRLSKLKK